MICETEGLQCWYSDLYCTSSAHPSNHSKQGMRYIRLIAILTICLFPSSTDIVHDCNNAMFILVSPTRSLQRDEWRHDPILRQHLFLHVFRAATICDVPPVEATVILPVDIYRDFDSLYFSYLDYIYQITNFQFTPIMSKNNYVHCLSITLHVLCMEFLKW